MSSKKEKVVPTNRFGKLVVCEVQGDGAFKVVDDNGGDGYSSTPRALVALKKTITSQVLSDKLIPEYQLIRLVRSINPVVKTNVDVDLG